MKLPLSQWNRFKNEDNIWLATVTPTGRPHLIPIWFVTIEDHIWLCTGVKSKKVKNIQNNANVSFALEDGNNPIIGEGKAYLEMNFTPQICNAFKEKYNWDLNLSENNIMIKIDIIRWVLIQ